ncbi:unnamed protein product [Agarophyton chilense]|eukprot:gb/GEZJ01000788.1/.p2 GENE.gb/GEZJ01000788.1/~~gb/GEZJ01000788.1/.p2  ORF type:complete len:382 (+),score=54.10 gb/GEZJ01000788.1/:2910-4055(+)
MTPIEKGSVKDDASLSSDSSGLTLEPLPDHLRFHPSDADNSTEERNFVEANPAQEPHTTSHSSQLPATGLTLPISNVGKRNAAVLETPPKRVEHCKESYSIPQTNSEVKSQPSSNNESVEELTSPQIYRMAMNRVTYNHIGFSYRFGCQDYAQNLQEAYKAYSEAASMGSRDALVYLAIAHIHGIAVEKSLAKAHSSLRRAILQGSADAVEMKALCSLAGTFENKRDQDKFLYLIELGTQMNAPGCLIWIGFCFEIGIGVQPDHHTAKMAYLAVKDSVSLNYLVQASYPGALTAGDPWLLLKCALFLLHSVGSPSVLGYAMDYLKQAAVLDCKEAQVYLAICLNDGKWLQRNTELALFWYREAAKGNCPQPIATRLVAELD